MPTGYTTISRQKSTYCAYPFRLVTQPLSSRYCNRVFDPASPKQSSIFLTLLRIYLQPGVSSTAKSPTTSTSLPLPTALLQPALQLISRHSRRLDAIETLKLLPPLVQAKDVKEFLAESLRAPIFETKVIGEIAKARRDEVATRVMVLEERRVKVVDSRMCVFGPYPSVVFLSAIFLLRSRGCFVDPFLPKDCFTALGSSVFTDYRFRLATVVRNVTSESGTIV